MLKLPGPVGKDCCIADRPANHERERAPPYDIRPELLTDREFERELIIAMGSTDPARLEYYRRLLKEWAERRARRSEN